MRLVDLNPRWVGSGGPMIFDRDGNPVPERSGIGMTFDCPCGCSTRGFVAFENPLDGGPPLRTEKPLWYREGETFEDLTLTPSIFRSEDKGGCDWHGFVAGGKVVRA